MNRDPIIVERAIRYEPGDHTQAASTISDSTTVGRAVLTAANAAAVRTAISVYGSGDDAVFNKVTTSNVMTGSASGLLGLFGHTGANGGYVALYGASAASLPGCAYICADTQSGGKVILATHNGASSYTDRLVIDSSGNTVPGVNNSTSLGDATHYWSSLYATDVRTNSIYINGVQTINSNRTASFAGVSVSGETYFTYSPFVGNYRMPLYDGTNASGTWNISITGTSGSCSGNAATATTASNATKVGNTTPSTFGLSLIDDESASMARSTLGAYGSGDNPSFNNISINGTTIVNSTRTASFAGVAISGETYFTYSPFVGDYRLPLYNGTNATGTWSISVTGSSGTCARSVSAGSYLTGGGTLSSDITLSVDASTSGTANKIAAHDAYGNLTCYNIVTTVMQGNASTDLSFWTSSNSKQVTIKHVSGSSKQVVLEGSVYGRPTISSSDGTLCVASSLMPSADNTYSFGWASGRWTTIYAATGTINTSDAREKENVAAISDENASAIVDGLVPKEFKFTDRVRTHAGFISQELGALLISSGIGDRAAYIYDQEADRYGLRMDELLPYLWRVVQMQRDEIALIKSRLASLEATQ